MKLYFPHLKPSDKPINAVDEYWAERHQCEALDKRLKSFPGGTERYLLLEQYTKMILDYKCRSAPMYSAIGECISLSSNHLVTVSVLHRKRQGI